MKNLLPFSILLWISIVVAETSTYQQLLGSMDEEARTRLRAAQGIVREVDLVQRSIIIGGYSYLVGPSYVENPLQVSLHGTDAGALELLKIGMMVEVSYFDFGYARIAFLIDELAGDALVIDELAEDALVIDELAEEALLEY